MDGGEVEEFVGVEGVSRRSRDGPLRDERNGAEGEDVSDQKTVTDRSARL